MTPIKFFYGSKEIVCKVEYHGKVFYGKARCNPNDTFNKETGERLAKLRALKRMSKFRLKVAIENFKYLKDTFHFYEKEYAAAKDFLERARTKKTKILSDLETFEANLKGTMQ